MEQMFMRQKQCLLNSNSGFTILELMVATTLSLLVMGIGFSSIFAARQAVFYDFTRTRLNQQMRGAFDILSANIRQAGENLPSGFPAIELVDGGAANVTDQLILRRNLETQVLTVCSTITAGSTNSLYFAATPIDPLNPRAGCIPTDPGTTTKYTAWHNDRISAGGSISAFIYDYGTLLGEFFTYSNDSISTANAQIFRNGTWTYGYTVAAEPIASTAAVYIIEEYLVLVSTTAPNANVLQIIKDKDYSTPYNIAPDITNLQVTITMTDGTVKTSFLRTDSWKLIKQIDVTLTGQSTWSNRIISTTTSGRFLPRNVFSQ